MEDTALAVTLARAGVEFRFGADGRGAVLAARGMDRPLLVGWSYGAPVALHWASRNPGRVLGVVSVDGAYPCDFTDPVTVARVRRMWRRWGWLLPVFAPLGMAAKMSAEQHAASNTNSSRSAPPCRAANPRDPRSHTG